VPRIPILKLGAAVEAKPPQLVSYTPVLNLEGLQLGIDNVRHDVWLSPAFSKAVAGHIANLIARFGNVEGVLSTDASTPVPVGRSGLSKLLPSFSKKPTEFKRLLLELHKSFLNQSKAKGNLTMDLLGRAAVVKFLRSELNAQFGHVLDRCRATLKHYEGVRQQKALEYRETVAAFQIAKKHILRQTGEELFRSLREIERESLGTMRRSLFGDKPDADYQVFLNQLIFLEEGRDSYLQAEHYVLIGGFENDPDSMGNIRALVCEFLQAVAPHAEGDNSRFDAWLSAPENAHELVGTGEPSERSLRSRLDIWTELLGREKLLDLAIAAYEVPSLFKEFTPLLDPQQLKYALVYRKDRERVEKLVEEHGKLPIDKLTAASARVSQANSTQRGKVAARFLRDFILYYRDLRRLEVLNRAMEKINLIGTGRLCELSQLNGTLYEFVLPEEGKSQNEKPVVRHVILKADVRDSTRVTRSLVERDMNPASYFSLNFYDPVNKLLAKYGASKVFVEGDAIILALLEREADPGLAVAQACVLAREMAEIVGGYNHLLQRAALPALELGIGISYQNSPPTYLLDGEHRIMISDALNESDRLSSCDKRMRKAMHGMAIPFNVYEFRAGEDPQAEAMKYNVGGIRISEAAFNRLREEISLASCDCQFPRLWGSENSHFYSGLVPVGADVFRRIIVRATRTPVIEIADYSLVRWTDAQLYEVCTNPAVYAAIERKMAHGKS
jgi:hypothetical protein